MTADNDATAARPGPGADPGTAGGVDAVGQAVLNLLASVPERPERLRVRVGDATIDLDWRPAPAFATLTGGVPAIPAPAPATPAPAPATPAPAPPVPVPPAAAGGPATVDSLHYVFAPMVGTFYRAPAPGAAPFVAEGDRVTAGQQIGIVEAMKLMMPVESDRAGRVVEVVAGDGRSVEYGEPLIAVDTTPDPA